MPNKKLPRCTCGFLEREANDPDSPIKFDAFLLPVNDGFKLDPHTTHRQAVS